MDTSISEVGPLLQVGTSVKNLLQIGKRVDPESHLDVHCLQRYTSVLVYRDKRFNMLLTL